MIDNDGFLVVINPRDADFFRGLKCILLADGPGGLKVQEAGRDFPSLQQLIPIFNEHSLGTEMD